MRESVSPMTEETSPLNATPTILPDKCKQVTVASTNIKGNCNQFGTEFRSVLGPSFIILLSNPYQGMVSPVRGVSKGLCDSLFLDGKGDNSVSNKKNVGWLPECAIPPFPPLENSVCPFDIHPSVTSVLLQQQFKLRHHGS